MYARELLAASQEMQATEDRLRKASVSIAEKIRLSDPVRESENPLTWNLDDRATLHQASDRARQKATCRLLSASTKN
jgi:hypothetical protein